MSSDDQETRELRYRLRQQNKVVGSQGQTIHLLRAELAEVRALNSKIERGELRRLERVTQELMQDNGVLTAENEALLEKLEASDEGTGSIEDAITSMAAVGQALREERLT